MSKIDLSNISGVELVERLTKLSAELGETIKEIYRRTKDLKIKSPAWLYVKREVVRNYSPLSFGEQGIVVSMKTEVLRLFLLMKLGVLPEMELPRLLQTLKELDVLPKNAKVSDLSRENLLGVIKKLFSKSDGSH